MHMQSHFLSGDLLAILAVVFLGLGFARTTIAAPEASSEAGPRINVRDFQDRVEEGNWAPAIQAAIDSVNESNGFTRGAEIYFPPGEYRIDQTLVLGRNRAQWGTQLLGHGATLIGSETLDAQPQEEIWAQLEQELEGGKLTALEDDKGLGTAILEIRNPPKDGSADYEGAGYVIEGLTFNRAAERNTGVGIKIPAGHAPKVTTFRSVRVFGQDIGVHVNYAWQIYFTDCIFRSNRIGVWGQNHFNAVSFVNCTFRRNHHHGLQLGPNQGQWGSSGVNITGSIFEANKGYGIYNAGGVQTVVTGCYFEANGNSIGIETPFGNTTVDTCHFWSTYPAEWNIVPHQGEGHIIINGTRNVQLRNNRYGKLNPIYITGELGGNLNRFDADPVVAEGVTFADSFRVASDDGLTYYDYDPQSNQFQRRTLTGENDYVVRQDDVEQEGD